jgi:competence protein ComEC
LDSSLNTLSFNRYPALRTCVLLVVGIIVGREVSLQSTLVSLLAVASLLLSCLFLMLTRSSIRFVPFLSLSLALLCIFLGAAKISSDRQSSISPGDSLFARPRVLVGTIKTPPTILGNRTRFELEGAYLKDGEIHTSFPATLLVTLKRTRKDTSTVHLQYGMLVAVRGMLSKPSAERNPGEFSPKQYYEANGISLFMNVGGSENLSVLDSIGGNWMMRGIAVPVKSFMLEMISTTIGGEEGEFLKGLLIGERTGISSETKQSFANSGVSHVLAVSGSNVAVVAAILLVLLEFFHLPKFVRVVLTSVGLLFYMLVTGSQPPVVRATVMALVFLFAGLFQEKSNPYNALGISALIILGFDARQLFDVGFQLSFVAVLSMVYLYPIANAWIGRISENGIWSRAVVWTLRVCAVSAVATLGTLPLTAIYFGKVSVIGILANIIVVPAVGLSVVLGFASIAAGIFSLWLAEVYAAVNQVVLWLTIEVARIAGGTSFAYVETFRFRLIDSLPFYVALMFVFHLTNKPAARTLFICLLVALNIAILVPPSPTYAAPAGKLRVSFIDVGQGDAALVEFPDGRTMLIDAGPLSHSYDAGERAVSPFLRRRGLSTIDMLIVSHPHSDHIGGAPYVLEHFDVKRVVDSGQPIPSEVYHDYLRDVAAERCEFKSVRAGTLLDNFTTARLYVLFPTSSFITTDTIHAHPNLNNTSVVLKLCYGDISILFSGDAEKEAEEEMVSVYGDFLHSTLLKTGHHGSITSSTPEYLEAVQPSFAVMSVGINNKFHHPSPVVLGRFRSMHVAVSRTDEEGAIVFETDGKTISQVDWRAGE